MKKLQILFLIMLASQGLLAKPSHELQIGLSYNRIVWHITYNALYSDYNFKRNKFGVQPCLRYTVRCIIYAKDSIPKLKLNMFTGYNVFGGKSSSDSSSFKDKYAFHSLELGIYPSYNIKSTLQLGFAYKLNYTPIIFLKNYGSKYQSDNLPRQWTTENVSDKFKKFSHNVGLTAIYQYHKFGVGIEAWFGLSNLDNTQPPIPKKAITETNYRILLGFPLSPKKKK